MSEHSNNKEFLNNDILDKILKKLNDSNFISIFFLLMDRISSDYYLSVIKTSKGYKERSLKKILQHQSKDLLIELLWTIKRYDLLKAINICHHNLQQYSSSFSLNIMWKSLYEMCESFEMEEDMDCLKEVFKEVSIPDKDPLEVFIVKAYNDKLISKSGLKALLNKFNKGNQKSKTWALHNEYYLIRSPTVTSPCGLAIIVNHENFSCEESDGLKLNRRKDSQLDVDALKKLWKSFGFEIETYLDFKAKEILCVFEELSERDLSSYDVFVTCYMSHGNEGIVYASDCEPIRISCLIDLMANKCKTLINKPKLFFIEACQGSRIQSGNSILSMPPVVGNSILSMPPDTDSSYTVYPSSTPLFSDVLVAISSIFGFVSFVSNGKNSWFIEALIENMELYGNKLSISEVLLKVNNHVSEKIGSISTQGQQINNCKQTVEQRHTFRKTLQLKKLSP